MRRPSVIARGESGSTRGSLDRNTASFDRGDSGTSSKKVDRQESATSLASDVSPMTSEAPAGNGAAGAGAGAGAGVEGEAGAGASTTPRGSKKSSSVHPVDF